MNQRMKWDAEAAFKRMNDKLRHHAVEPHEYIGGYTVPYTPPSNIGPERLAQLRKYEPPAKPKGRDYDAILRAAKKAPVGYYEDAPRGIRFGGQPLPSASTKPHGKDVDTADGGTPLIGMCGVERLWFGGMEYLARSRAMPCRRDAAMRWWQNTRTPTIPEMCSWLEQNGHADAAAQLRGAPRDDVATGGGRVWKDKYNGWHGVWLNGRSFGKSATCASFEDITASRDLPEDTSAYEVELFGPERDAILSECRKAMGL